MNPEGRLLNVAARISDGQRVDWHVVESTSGRAERGVLEQLRLVERIAANYRDVDGVLDDGQDVPQEWGNLKIVERIGGGNYGEVYRAWDTRLQRDVALKMLYPGWRQEDDLEAVLREARLLARINHPNVATVYQADCIDGRVGMWMEYARGRTLDEIVREQGPWGPDEAIVAGAQVCEAIAVVHQAGVIHRDIKGQNLIREEGGRIVLTDFGTGSDLRAEDDAGGGSTSGTPLYMAPETLLEGKATAESDIYSVGVLLFYLLTGVFPVSASGVSELRRQHKNGLRKRLCDVRPGLPHALCAAIDKALHPDPSRRWTSAAQMGQALRGCLARKTPSGFDPKEESRRNRVAAAAVAVALLLTVLILGFIANPTGRTEHATVSADARIDYYLQAEKHYGEGDFARCIASLRLELSDHPDSAQAYRLRSEAYAAIGDNDRAFQDAQKAHDLAVALPSAEQLQIDAMFALTTGDYHAAAQDDAALAERFPDDSRWLRYQAEALVAAGDLKGALVLARKASRLDPDDFGSAGCYPFVLAKMGRWQEALEEIRKARSRLGDQTYFYWPEALAHLVGGDYGAAARSAETLQGADKAVYRQEGTILSAQAMILGGRSAEAKKLLESPFPGVERENQEITFRHSFLLTGLLLSERQDVGEVAEVLNGPDGGNPLDLRTLSFKGRMAAALGEVEILRRVVASLKSIRDQWPTPAAKAYWHHLSAELALAEGHADVAEKCLLQAKYQFPNVFFLWTYARILEELGKPEAALSRYDEVVARKGEMLDSGGAWVVLQARERAEQIRHGISPDGDGNPDDRRNRPGVGFEVPIVRAANGLPLLARSAGRE